MTTSFSGRTAIVTGATRGIGRAIASAFLRRGAKVIGVYAADSAAAERFLAEHHAAGNQLLLRQCDISDQVQVAALYQELARGLETIDILVNNAGIRRDSLMATLSPEDWQRVLDVNLTGTYLMAKHATLAMLANKFGRIINITSPVARLGFAGQTNYAASKAGQIALTKSLAKEVARKKITVNCVSPGFIRTDLLDDLAETQLADYKKMVPMRRFGSPEEVAAAVLFLAGEDAAYITGSVIEVSGGL